MENKDPLFQSYPSFQAIEEASAPTNSGPDDELSRVKTEMKKLEDQAVSKDEEIRHLNKEIKRLKMIIESAVTDLTRAIEPAAKDDTTSIRRPRNRNPASDDFSFPAAEDDTTSIRRPRNRNPASDDFSFPAAEDDTTSIRRPRNRNPASDDFSFPAAKDDAASIRTKNKNPFSHDFSSPKSRNVAVSIRTGNRNPASIRTENRNPASIRIGDRNPASNEFSSPEARNVAVSIRTRNGNPASNDFSSGTLNPPGVGFGLLNSNPETEMLTVRTAVVRKYKEEDITGAQASIRALIDE